MMLVMKNVNVRNVLQDFNLEVKEGELVVVTGENGAGKTTLFNAISGQVIPTTGKILIDSVDVTQQTQAERARLIANVCQDPKVSTVAGMTLRENLNAAFLRGQKRSWVWNQLEQRDSIFRERLSELEMGLENRLDDRVGNLSGGQRQALSIVMAFLLDFKILLLDEITAALNEENAVKVIRLVQNKCRKDHRTCLMITHNLQQIQTFGDRVVTLPSHSYT